MKTDIETPEHVNALVETFYDRVRKNAALGPLLAERIHDQWDDYTESITAWWQNVLFAGAAPDYDAFILTDDVPLEHDEFRLWLTLFRKTVNDMFEGKNANQAMGHAEHLAAAFEIRNVYRRNHNATNGSATLSAFRD